MANEATLKVQKTIPISMICADGTGIEKGAILKMSAGMTILAETQGAIVGGICDGEKVASDGQTYVGVFRGPGDIFEVTLSGSASFGDSMMLSVDNKITKLTANLSGAKCIGTLLESGTNDQRKLLELNIGDGLA